MQIAAAINTHLEMVIASHIMILACYAELSDKAVISWSYVRIRGGDPELG